MSGLFGAKPVSQSAPVIASLLMQTSCWGRAIPLVYGRTRLAGNLVWYGDFTPTANTTRSGGKGGGGGVTSTSYSYAAAITLVLCEGPIDSIPIAWAGKEVTTPAALNLTVYLGSQGQAAPSFMSSGHPSEALGYSQVAHVSSSSYQLGDSASLPTHSFEVLGLEVATANVANVFDASVTAVISDLLLNTQRGVGFPAAQLGSLTQMEAYCRVLGIWVSPLYQDQERAADMIQRLLDIANTAAVFSEGVLKFIPYGGVTYSGNGVTFTPSVAVQYALTDDDFLHDEGTDPIIGDRIANENAENHFRIGFRDRTTQYADNVAEYKDDNSIALYGLRSADVVNYNEINDANTARMVAQVRGQRKLYQRNTYKFRLGINYIRLEPMDIVTLTESTGTALSALPVRITSVVETEANELEIEAEDFLDAIDLSPVYSFQTPGGYSQDYNASPGNISTPFIFDAPGLLAESGFELWVAAAGAGALWGGAIVWISVDGGSSYTPVGELPGPARVGVLTGAVSIGRDPDYATTVPVDLSASKGVMASGTATDADNGTTLCIMDRELFAFQSATLTGTNQYTLGTLLRRGLHNSTRSAHSSGAPFARLDGGIVTVPYDKTLIGQTVYFKFTSINVFGGGIQDVASVAAYSYTIQGPIGGVSPNQNLLSTRSWVVGTNGSQGNYTDNFDGTNADSSIVLAGQSGAPLGIGNKAVPLWKTVGAGTTKNGGWDNHRDLFGIDPSKTYRVLQPFWWNGVGAPSVYLGTDSVGTYVEQLDGSAAANPHFWYAALSGLLQPNKWYMAVGVIHGAGYSGTGLKLAGIYDCMTGLKLAVGAGSTTAGTPSGNEFGAEFRFKTGVVPYGQHRAYQWGANNSSSHVYFGEPHFQQLNGSEPSLLSLMALAGADSPIAQTILPDPEFQISRDQTYWYWGSATGVSIALSGDTGGPGGVMTVTFDGTAKTIRSRGGRKYRLIPGQVYTMLVRLRRTATITNSGSAYWDYNPVAGNRDAGLNGYAETEQPLPTGFVQLLNAAGILQGLTLNQWTTFEYPFLATDGGTAANVLLGARMSFTSTLTGGSIEIGGVLIYPLNEAPPKAEWLTGSGGTAAVGWVGNTYATTGGVTIPNSVFAAGNRFQIFNASASSITITQGSGVTLTRADTAATGNRTLFSQGLVTIWFESASLAWIAGNAMS